MRIFRRKPVMKIMGYDAKGTLLWKVKAPEGSSWSVAGMFFSTEQYRRAHKIVTSDGRVFKNRSGPTS